METVNISLPEAVKQFLEEQVSAGVYNSVSDYIQTLVQEDQKRKAQETIEAFGGERDDGGGLGGIEAACLGSSRS